MISPENRSPFEQMRLRSAIAALAPQRDSAIPSSRNFDDWRRRVADVLACSQSACVHARLKQPLRSRENPLYRFSLGGRSLF